MIISGDVQFVENESQDGTVDINVKIVSNVENDAWDVTVHINVKIVSTVDNDDMEEEVVQTPHVSQPFATPSTPMR